MAPLISDNTNGILNASLLHVSIILLYALYTPLYINGDYI